jgi:hypothetical protein
MADGGGSKMRRVVAMAITGTILAVGLGGCSSFSLDYFKSTPPTVQVQLESNPPGADARTSLGPGCKTPCAVSVPAPDTGFSVSYALPKFQPATVPVQVIHNPGDVGPGAEARPQVDAAEETQAAEIRGAGPRGIGIPRSERNPSASRSQPLTGRTAARFAGAVAAKCAHCPPLISCLDCFQCRSPPSRRRALILVRPPE